MGWECGRGERGEGAINAVWSFGCPNILKTFYIVNRNMFPLLTNAKNFNRVSPLPTVENKSFITQ